MTLQLMLGVIVRLQHCFENSGQGVVAAILTNVCLSPCPSVLETYRPRLAMRSSSIQLTRLRICVHALSQIVQRWDGIPCCRVERVVAEQPRQADQIAWVLVQI